MKMTDQSKSRDAVLTNVKENDLLIENCFLCHKSDHTSKECLNRSFRINTLDDEFDHSLCNLIDEISSIEENYFEKSFLVDVILFSQDEFFKLRSLINSDSTIYILIHTKLVDQICQKLKIQLIQLAKEKLIREYDEKLTKKIITHKILLNLTVESHKKLTVSMLIIDINHHDVILEKF